ncbi:hypothetical protein Fcan01_11591 [Folsomia candida]|uniref:Uncharacterized protein n=1 Tax=Folsomia candida TaxID=158441 RepID=A0A226E7T6_FOLCA|nr:hypothetical protein Fcan01_11591 [Folsomia candida]
MKLYTLSASLGLLLIVGFAHQTTSFSYGQLANVIKGGLGVSDFVSHVRNTIGKAGEFTNKNGFEYNNVYNSILQYSILNAYLERENHKLLTQQSEHQAQAHDSMEKFNITQTIFLLALLLTAIISATIGIMQIRRLPRPQRRRQDPSNY